MKEKQPIKIGIIGGGPSGLFVYKRLVEAGRKDIEVHIFERKKQLGAGMPYSADGANDEHVTNVSGNEIPTLVTTIAEWVLTLSHEILNRFGIDPLRFNEYKVLPRLFFGLYLSDQFTLLAKKADLAGIPTFVHLKSNVTDIKDHPENDSVVIEVAGMENMVFDAVVITTGHHWPVKHEGKIPGYYDSPYPPSKLELKIDHPIAIKGSSLTAVDAIKTLARHNGTFKKNKKGITSFTLDKASCGFKIIMYSKGGMLPAVRFNLEDPHLSNPSLLTKEDVASHIVENNGFLSLDFLFENDFKEIFRKKDPGFYGKIKDMSVEDFVDYMMGLRGKLEPFELLKLEYAEAEESIKLRKSIYWKEMLGVLSFALNYPAKHLSAEDMLRLQKTLSPLISIIIAYIPQSSCEEMLALYEKGLLEIKDVGAESNVAPSSVGGADYTYTNEKNILQTNHYSTYIDCTGQPHLPFEDFPFKGLIKGGTVSQAVLKFRSKEEGRKALENSGQIAEKDRYGNHYLKVPGIAISDDFQVMGLSGVLSQRVYMMAVPYMSGHNPDYSGLDFCEEASSRVVGHLLSFKKIR